MFYKRSVIILLIGVILSLFCGCKKDSYPKFLENYSITFFDLGRADSTLIYADGKTVLIDTGKTKQHADFIKNTLKQKTDTIDYLFLTSLDDKNIGNADYLLESFNVINAFVPFVEDKSGFPYFENALNVIDGANLYYLALGQSITVGDLKLYVLSPSKQSEYNKINDGYISEKDIQDVSACIYLSVMGKRILISGDITAETEQDIVFNEASNSFDAVFGENSVNLYEIDFYKVANNGVASNNSETFINRLKPKYAVFSVGDYSVNGLPATLTLTRLQNANANVEFLRTDVFGNITVYFNEYGNYYFKTV